MLHARVATLAAAIALAVAGCGSAKTQSQSTATATTTAAVTIATGTPLTRAQLLAKADVICERANTKLKTMSARTIPAYVRLLPQMALYYNSEAESLSALVPPASMEPAWKQIVNDVHLYGEYEISTARYAKEKQEKLATHEYKNSVATATQWIATAKTAGFTACAHTR